MKVTVCELSDTPSDFARDWAGLVDHVQSESSDLVLLPEMPFYPWFGHTPTFDPSQWQAAVAAHDEWQARCSELAPAVVLSSRPITRANRRLNEGFVWEHTQGYRAVHAKHYLPDEDGVWEASWYSRGDQHFTPVQIGAASVGFAICTEMWAMEQVRLYGKAGVHLLVTPRLTGKTTVDKWLTGGRAAAIVAGAFSLSSNRVDAVSDYGGQGWVIGPDGDVLALTSQDQPFVTIAVDLAEAERAKHTYPRYAIG